MATSGGGECVSLRRRPLVAVRSAPVRVDGCGFTSRASGAAASWDTGTLRERFPETSPCGPFSRRVSDSSVPTVPDGRLGGTLGRDSPESPSENLPHGRVSRNRCCFVPLSQIRLVDAACAMSLAMSVAGRRTLSNCPHGQLPTRSPSHLARGPHVRARPPSTARTRGGSCLRC